jgi:phage baseplate assembly protein W
MAIVNTQLRKFSDINFDFTINAATKDIDKVNDEAAIKQSIQSLIRTINYERKFHPEIGCQITSLLFDNFEPRTIGIMKQTVQNVINQFEPRARIINVDIHDVSDRNEIDIQVTFRTTNINAPVIVSTTLSRAR